MARPGPTEAPRPPAAAAVWGDGFARDGLADLWGVRDWSLCSPDEYILLFPRLIPRANEFPPVLLAHLEGCVAARAWRLARLDGGAPLPRLRSRRPDRESGAARHRDWFADDAVTRLLRRTGLLGAAPERVEAERALLIVLDGLLAEIQAHRVPAWDEGREALFPFGAGIHPAYLWPQAAVSPARGVAAGWLGHLDRGRAALMPMVVAEVLLDALGGVSADRHMIALAGSAGNLDVLRRAARRRWSGLDATVRLAPDAASLARVFSGRGRPVPAAEAGA